MEDITAQNASAVVGEIRIQVVRDGPAVRIAVASSVDLLTGLGLLEAAKDTLKQQAQQPQSPLVVARGNLPRA